MIGAQSRSALAMVAAVLFVVPSTASAHGPIAPLASSFLARVTSRPAAVRAVVVDGDQRLWVKVAPGHTLVVRDPRGAPWVRIDRRGVWENRNSELWYLDQT